MRNKTAALRLLAVVAGAGGVLGSAAAQTPGLTKPEQGVNIDVSKADLSAVANVLRKEAHTDFEVRDSPRPYHPVTVHLIDASLPTALRVIADSAGAKVRRNASGVYVFSLLGVPDAADVPPSPTPKTTTPLDPADLKGYRITLQHTTPNALLKLMHWDQPVTALGTPGETLSPDAGVFLPQRGLFTPHPRLPEGVAAIVGLTRAAGLLVQATPEGFRRVRNAIKTLDIAERGYLPDFKFSAVTVSEDDFADAFPLRREAANRGKFKFTTDLTALSGGWISRLFLERSRVGLGVRQAALVPGLVPSDPPEWVVPGYLISAPKLMGDGSVRLVLETLHAMNDVSTTTQVPRNGVVAVFGRNRWDQLEVALVKVDY